MENGIIITFTILAITTILFMISKIRADFVALLSLLALVLTGVISAGEALAGFSNSLVIMIAALFIVGEAIFRSGIAAMAGNLLVRLSKNSEWRLLILLMAIVGIGSAFMSNTGTVAVFLPIVVSMALSMRTSPGKFLIPLAFASSLGGVITLIGTPPNLVVSEAAVDAGYERIGFFDFTPIGIVVLLTGMLFMATIGKALLPKGNKGKNVESKEEMSPQELVHYYHVDERIFSVRVPEDSKMVNQKLADLKIPANYQLAILQIERKTMEGHAKLFSVTFHRMAGPKTTILGQDVLFIQGRKEKVEQLCADYGLELLGKEESDVSHLISKELGVAEVLLTPHSSLINTTVAQGFREKYNLNILGINRKGNYILENMSNVKLRFGDALLVQGAWSDIERLTKDANDVVVVGHPEEQAGEVQAKGKAPIVAVIMILMLIMMTFEVIPAVISVLIAALLMVVTGCLRSLDDAYRTIDWESVILIAAMLPMATALENTGGAQLLADTIVEWLGDFGPLAVLAGLYLATNLLSQFMSNTAAAVLFAPIGIAVANTMAVSPYPFLIAVSIGASMAFSTPVASPTNAMVMTAGGYKFSDFMKIGIPLQIIMFIVMMFAIPLFFPF